MTEKKEKENDPIPKIKNNASLKDVKKGISEYIDSIPKKAHIPIIDAGKKSTATYIFRDFFNYMKNRSSPEIRELIELREKKEKELKSIEKEIGAARRADDLWDFNK